MDAQKVFEIVVREHADMLTQYIRSVVRDDALADDIFQETMIVAWRRLDDFDQQRSFAPWLRGIARRVIMAHRRRSAKGFYICNETVMSHLDAWAACVDSQTGDSWNEKLDVLRDCVAALPEHYHQTVRLRYTDELSAIEISKRLEISVPGVKKRLQRARERLFDCVQRKLNSVPASEELRQ